MIPSPLFSAVFTGFCSVAAHFRQILMYLNPGEPQPLHPTPPHPTPRPTPPYPKGPAPNLLKSFRSEILGLSNRCSALLQILTTNRTGSIPNFPKGCLSENLVLWNRCAAVLSIANTDNKQGRFDSTKFSGGFIQCYRTAALLCYALQTLTTNRTGSIAPLFLISVAKTDNKQGRFRW